MMSQIIQVLLCFPAGGTKKFLYSGPVSRRRGPQFDDDVDDREWNFKPTVKTGIQDDDRRKYDLMGEIQMY